MQIVLDLNNPYYTETVAEIAAATGMTETVVCMAMIRRAVINYREQLNEARADAVLRACDLQVEEEDANG